MEDAKTFTEVSIIGEAYFHRFRMNDSSFLETECSASEYGLLSTPNAITPVTDGGVWDGSCSRRVYNTPDGKMSAGQYATDNGKYVAMLSDNAQYGAKTFDGLSALKTMK